jgi:hypothetical protein
MARFFVYPFGVDGTITPNIPTADPGDGTVSYQTGWGIDYELDLATNPSALPITRPTTNSLMFDITTALQQYQTLGVPDFITTGDNLGSPWPYDIWARVRYNPGSGMQVYESLVTANTSAPTDATKWRLASGGVDGVPTGVVLDYTGVVPPTGYIMADGSAISRTTYAGLFVVNTIVENGTTTNGSPIITAVADTSKFFVGMEVEGTFIPAASTIVSIITNTSVTISNNATGGATNPMTYFLWGNGDGSTTFNIIDKRRAVTVGAGGSASSPVFTGTLTGQYGGEEVHTQTIAEIASHNHTIPNGFIVGGGSPSSGGTGTTYGGQPNTNNTGSSTPFNIMQLGVICTSILKT